MRIIAISFLLLSFSFIYSQQSEWNSSRILHEIEKLNTTGSVLYIAAHPDDENTRLITYFANEKKVRTGYLSLTRGDGGQNLIGEEQGSYLGVIRTQELLAARKLDGGEQFFTRAVDFGYSKSAEETFSIWEHDSLLADVVWVIRNFRPDIIITRFPPDDRAGHGQHEVSALIAEEAFDAAANPKMFPEQLQFVTVWQTQRLFWNNSLRWDETLPDKLKNGDKNIVTINVGVFNPLLGKSYGEIAAESRTNHKSQGFGSTPTRGDQTEYLYLKKGTQCVDVFDGTLTSWERYRQGTEIKSELDKIISEYSISKPENSVSALLHVYELLEKLPSDKFVEFKKQQLQNILVACLGLWMEPVALKQVANQASMLKIESTVLSRTKYPAELVSISIPGKVIQLHEKLTEGKNIIDTFEIFIDETMSSNPYWLEKNYAGMYNVPSQLMRGKAENDPAVSFTYHVQIGEKIFQIKRAVVYKETDAVEGEVYKPLLIQNRVEVEFASETYIFPSGKPHQVFINVKNNTAAGTGIVKLNIPSNWNCEPATYEFKLENAENNLKFSFTLYPPNDTASAEISAEVVVPVYESALHFTSGSQLIEYEHIPAQLIHKNASAKVVSLNTTIPTKKIAYVEGAGDKVDESLRQLGVNITTLKPEEISAEVLKNYDVVIIGVRAYNVSKKLADNQTLLMSYVKDGGLLITQYSTNWDSYAEQIGPYSFKIGRGRVTDEFSPVEFLLPEHPVLNSPNKITKDDFTNWIQERGIYFATDLAPEYVTPLAFTDPGESPLNGGLIITDYGTGAFMYTGLAFFRELPAGVPGAYRLFMNFIEYKK